MDADCAIAVVNNGPSIVDGRRSVKRSRLVSSHRRQPHGYQNLSQVNFAPLASSILPESDRCSDEFTITRLKIGAFDLTERHSAIPFVRGYSYDFAEHARFSIIYKTSVTESDRLCITLFKGKYRIIVPVEDGNVSSVCFNRKESKFTITWKMHATFESQVEPSLYTACPDFTDNQISKCNGVFYVWVDQNTDHPRMHYKWNLKDIRDFVNTHSRFYLDDIISVADPVPLLSFDSIEKLWVVYSEIGLVKSRQHFVKSRENELQFLFSLCADAFSTTHRSLTVSSITLLSFVAETWNHAVPAQVVITRLKAILHDIHITVLWQCLNNSFVKYESNKY